MLGRLPLDQQLAALCDMLARNDVLMEVLERAATLGLPGWYLTAGCLYQTVWNVVTGRPPANGIKDYDILYFDEDLSWESEDRVVAAGRRVFADLPVEMDIHNEARVHLWYEKKFGVPCAPYDSAEAGIDSFPATTTCLGLSPMGSGPSTRLMGCQTYSTWSCGLILCLPLDRSTRPR